MANDCIFRHRNLYKFIMMPDQDEFLYFPTLKQRSEEALLEVFENLFWNDTKASSTLYYSAMYHVHCFMVEVRHHTLPRTGFASIVLLRGQPSITGRSNEHRNPGEHV